MSGRGNVQTHTFSLTAAADGTASASKLIKGMLREVTIEYQPSSDAGTDVLVTGLVKGGPGAGVTVTYVNIANNATNTTLFPQAFSQSATGTNSALVYLASFPIDNIVTASIAGQTEGFNVTITLYVE